MKAIQKIFSLFVKNNKNEPKSKKDANIPYNATLFFQFSLIVSITITAMVINSAFKVKHDVIATPKHPESEEIFFYDFTIVLPDEPKEAEVKPEPKKVINPVEILITDIPTETVDIIDTDPEPIKIDTDKPVTIVSPVIPAPKLANTTYNILGVERVPVFPGCEALADNTQRRDCMSTEIGKFINRRFNTDLANELGLKGSHRIYVTFVINKNGNVVNTQVKAPHDKLEKEAKRVVNMIPKMLPGLQNDKEVDVVFAVPILFNIEN